MLPKRKAVWDKLAQKMSAKQTTKDGQKASSKMPNAPSEITVQRLSFEPENKQTYKPIQPT